jgi:hypothetical protein
MRPTFISLIFAVSALATPIVVRDDPVSYK